MQVEGMLSRWQTLGTMAVFVVGLGLGAAVPVLAGVEITAPTTACEEASVAPAEGIEETEPPSSGRGRGCNTCR
jgi:hypothetical protein